jgi:hypothetical protein
VRERLRRSRSIVAASLPPTQLITISFYYTNVWVTCFSQPRGYLRAVSIRETKLLIVILLLASE